MKRLLQISKGIINYIFAMIFAIIFALFLDATVGWFLLLALIMAPLLSVFLAWLSSLLLTVSCEMKESLLSKGDICSMTIHLRNKSIFPTPPLDISFTKSPGVSCFAPQILASVISKSTQSFTVSFTAKICGESTIGISQIRTTDYLGLFSFPIRKTDYTSLQRKVAVIPDIAEISARDDNLLKTMQASLHTEGSDDTTESSTASFGGFPGYNNREYVPGDPLKRINWKQSARKNKLLVRLDDEMASQAINVVLDSVFQKEALDTKELLTYACFLDCTEENVLEKTAEAAIENALGILYVLLRHNYTINFYVRLGNAFTKYEIQDEVDLESLRLDLSHYSFSEDGNMERFPMEELQQSQSAVSLFSTPNSYENAYGVLSTYSENMYTTIYSVIEEGKKRIVTQDDLSLLKTTKTKASKESLQNTLKDAAQKLIIPFLLALISSVNVFYAFNIPFFSIWTVLQILVCCGIFALCEFVNKHRFIGGMIITVLIFAILFIFTRIVFAADWGRTYIYWFMSGGDSIDTTFAYLMSLLLVFTVFFAMVIYYFSIVLYRTSFLMLVSLIPFVVHVKLMHKMELTYAVFTVALNILVFLLHNRTNKDKEKRKVGPVSEILSLGLYTLLFLLIGMAVPKEEDTRYYYVFENLFLGGNVTTALPEEFSAMSEHSGNADNFEQLNDRKLYEISSVDMGPVLYMTRQTFDYYDFDSDFWYAYNYSSAPTILPSTWEFEKSHQNQTLLAKALHAAEALSPGFMEKYGLERIPENFKQAQDTITVTTTNFHSVAYITPPGTYSISITGDDLQQDYERTAISQTGIYQRLNGFLDHNLKYEVTYYDLATAPATWVNLGGSDMDITESIHMLTELTTLLSESEYTDCYNTAYAYLSDAIDAQYYAQICETNIADIPKRVQNLAKDITADCTNDWEKATALANYFEENNFVYDLSYDAPDDSVEYFLFKGKTGTCSDFASAYILMARSVGLIARYAEGFVPDMEYGSEYVIRTDCGHAYPEVYISNVGFVVFEATKPAIYHVTDTRNQNRGFTGYLMLIGYRTVLIFAGVSAGIILLLFIHLVLRPFISEWWFRRHIRQSAPSEAVIMTYKRLQTHYTKKSIENAHTLTPKEYREAFLHQYDYDVSTMTNLVETAAYTPITLAESQRSIVTQEYKQIRQIIRKHKKKRTAKT